MRAASIFLLVALLLAYSHDVKAQFVTLQNGEFWLNGTRFFPEVVHVQRDWGFHNGYNNPPILSITSAGRENCPANNPYCSPCSTQTDCNILMLNEFQQIASLGFNTIRIAVNPSYIKGINTRFDPYDMLPNDYEGFYIDGAVAVPFSYLLTYWLFEYPYDPNLDPDIDVLFDKVELVLDIAEQAGLKVILLSGGGAVLPEGELSASDPYPTYLGQLAARISYHPALLAYDLQNEPGLPTSSIVNPGSKQRVCEVTTLWYDAIRANDPNHLITIGGGTVQDVMNWDPQVMKLDFISPHMYPIRSPKDGWNLQEALNRYRINLHWHYKNPTKPWLIGETGFSVEDGRNSGYPEIDNPPNEWIDGTEQQGKEFANLSRKACWDCNVIGYTWWVWRDGRPLNFVQDVIENGIVVHEGDEYYGLIRTHHHPSTQAGRKPVVDEFLQNTPQNHPRGICEQPPNYYNAWNLTNPNNRITRTVVDQHGNPITNAVIEVHTSNGPSTIPKPPLGFRPADTFTDENGSFTAIPADNFGIYPTKIVQIRISAPGAELKSSSWDLDNWSTYTYFPEGEDIVLQRLDFSTDIHVIGETVETNTSEAFIGQSTLTATNVIVDSDATADFKARNEVNASGEFHARFDSETHLFCEQTTFDCADLSSIPFSPRIADPNAPEEVVEEPKQIEVFFRLASNSINIYPNPSTGMVTVHFSGEDFEDTEKIIHVYDLAGRQMMNWNGVESSVELDLRSEARGIYLVKVTSAMSGQSIINQKIIIQ